MTDLTPVKCPCGWSGTVSETYTDYRPKAGGFVDEPMECCPRCSAAEIYEEGEKE